MAVDATKKGYINEPVNEAENVVSTWSGVVDVKLLSFSAAEIVLIVMVIWINNKKFMRLWEQQNSLTPSQVINSKHWDEWYSVSCRSDNNVARDLLTGVDVMGDIGL